MQKIKDIIKKINSNKKAKIATIIIIALFFVVPVGNITITNIIKQIQLSEIEGEPPVKYEVKSTVDIKTAKVLVTFCNPNGIEQIRYKSWQNDGDDDWVVLNGGGKFKISIDYQCEDLQTYTFYIKESEKEEERHDMYFEVPREKTDYKKVNGVYAHEPDLKGYIPEYTRYLYQNDSGNLVPGNWINSSQPENWYDYNARDSEGNKSPKWANIYVESKGIESYYVWIPRYMYKNATGSEAGNERVDVKFINVYNEWIDGETEEKLTYEELTALGYVLPEAFSWNIYNGSNLIIPGYWMSKYQLSNLGSYKLYFDLNSTRTSFRTINLSSNVTAASFTYAINGEIIETKDSLEEYALPNNNPGGTNTINITALDSNGSIIGSMTKQSEAISVNPPDLTGFDKGTTFYVYWDEDGNEHNEIPISKSPPEEWYNYSYSEWANIVTRNNEVESYFVWIPRYQYALDNTAQRTEISFIEGTSTETKPGYVIPEAFKWGDSLDKQLTGYWMSKYQLSNQSAAKINSDLTLGETVIHVGEIKGTSITNAVNTQTVTDPTTGEETTVTTPKTLKIEYYIDGNKVHEGDSITENYTFTGLHGDTEYVVNIIIREQETNKYIGAFTKRVKTIKVNEPDLTGFDKDTTYYVCYDDEGNEQRISLNETQPNNWYDYSEHKWANIVTTANGTESYFVWIPRYQYRLQETDQRVDVQFIPTTKIEPDNNYNIPEAFKWGDSLDKQLSGYWMSKYQLSN